VPRDNNQILELIGTNAFENFIRELEKEGVGIATAVHPPKPGREVFPLRTGPISTSRSPDHTSL
jgi:hypothetical protein